jgi:hypothetical protein
MTEKFVSFLIRRIAGKLDSMADAGTHEEIVAHIEDIREYLDELRTVVSEAITP